MCVNKEAFRMKSKNKHFWDIPEPFMLLNFLNRKSCLL